MAGNTSDYCWVRSGMLTSTTCDGAREEVGLPPAVDDGLVVDVLDHTVRSTG